MPRTDVGSCQSPDANLSHCSTSLLQSSDFTSKPFCLLPSNFLISHTVNSYFLLSILYILPICSKMIYCSVSSLLLCLTINKLNLQYLLFQNILWGGVSAKVHLIGPPHLWINSNNTQYTELNVQCLYEWYSIMMVRRRFFIVYLLSSQFKTNLISSSLTGIVVTFWEICLLIHFHFFAKC